MDNSIIPKSNNIDRHKKVKNKKNKTTKVESDDLLPREQTDVINENIVFERNEVTPKSELDTNKRKIKSEFTDFNAKMNTELAIKKNKKKPYVETYEEPKIIKRKIPFTLIFIISGIVITTILIGFLIYFFIKYLRNRPKKHIQVYNDDMFGLHDE